MPPRPHGEHSQTITEPIQPTLVDIARTFADREVSATRQLPKRPDSPLAEEFVQTFLNSAFEAGVDDDFMLETTGDVEHVAKNRRVRTALTWASGQALRVLDERVMTAPSDNERREAEEDRDATQQGAERLFELFGIVTRPREEKVITREIPTIVNTNKNKPVHLRAMDAMNSVSRETLRSYDAMALYFADIYIGGQSRVDRLRQVVNRSSASREAADKELVRTIASMNIYTHQLSNILHSLERPELQRKYVKHLQVRVAQLVQHKDIVEPNTPEQITFNQMITGIELEIASKRLLTKASKEYGWTNVRGATIKEDIKDQTDLFITVDGHEIPLDSKSTHSFQKQEGYSIGVPGIKIKQAKNGTKVIVIDAQYLGNPDKHNDLAFEFEDGDTVARSVDQAIQHILHPHEHRSHRDRS